MTLQRKPITDKKIAHVRDLVAARQRKRNKAWRDALERAGWTESQLKTAVIAGRVELPTKSQGG